MKGAGCRTKQQQGVVQHAAGSSGLRRVFQLADKPPVFLIKKTAIDTKVLPAIRILRFVRQLMSEIESNCTRQMVAAPDSVFAADLVGRHSGRIGFEREVNQVEHRLQILAWLI